MTKVHGEPVAKISLVWIEDNQAAVQRRAARARQELRRRTGCEHWALDARRGCTTTSMKGHALDTNVLAYAEGASGTIRRDQTLELIQRLPPEGVVLPAQALERAIPGACSEKRNGGPLVRAKP